jgi:hypothetical protein
VAYFLLHLLGNTLALGGIGGIHQYGLPNYVFSANTKVKIAIPPALAAGTIYCGGSGLVTPVSNGF